MSLPRTPRLPVCKEQVGSYNQQLSLALTQMYRDIVAELSPQPVKSAPTNAGRFVGDFAPNSDGHIELGASPNKYTLMGWIWNGSTWLERRTPTGN